NACLSVPDSVVRPRLAGLDRAFAFLKRNTNEDGEIGRMDETAADYPNYATSLAVTAMVKARRAGSSPDIERMIGHLRVQQFSEAGGLEPCRCSIRRLGYGRSYPSSSGYRPRRPVDDPMRSRGPASRRSSQLRSRCH